MNDWDDALFIDENPYSENTWEEILQLGKELDLTLIENGIPLTVGAEPTFVDIQNQHESEWTHAAIGEKKRHLASKILEELKNTIEQPAILIYETGKWCGNEACPRWALSLYWHLEKTLIDASCFINASDKRQYTFEELQRFAKHLKQQLKIDADDIEIFSDNEKLLGYLLPIVWNSELECFDFVHPDKLYILTNNIVFKQMQHFLPHLPQKKAGTEKIPDKDGKEILQYPRLELNNGKITVYLPNISQQKGYFFLWAALENVSQSLKIPFILQGFGPALSGKIKKLSITPDPGVLEINCPPFCTWSELNNFYQNLFKVMHQHHLVGYRKNHLNEIKFTGGGHHITLGSPYEDMNPFIMRKDLLQSFITYWQHHPALSYLFSGDYIGHTSQAPRVDEGHHYNLDELEIAFQELSALKGEKINFEMIHSILNHFLTDITGNPHRSEFCLDKFFAQDKKNMSGLLELRAFEMQPYSYANLLMIQLVMALLCFFWKNPFVSSFKRWGSSLQDKYMLPHFICEDLKSVLQDLNHGGFHFKFEWFKPFIDLKFKHWATLHYEITSELEEGSRNQNGLTVELRKALEFAPVLGQEMASGLSSRTVDPALERLQVKIIGLDYNRFCLVCNDVEVPLIKIEDDEIFSYIVGIRYKAEMPMITAQPTIPSQLPLRFSLIERKTGVRVLSFHLDTKLEVLNCQKNSIQKENNSNVRIIDFDNDKYEIKKSVLRNQFPDRYTFDLRRK